MRIDPSLWTELEAWAQDELRSVNGQVEYILKQAVQKRRGSSPTGLPSTQPAASAETAGEEQDA
jgi:hypothetical protein